MLPLLLNKIIQTDKLLFLHLVTQKNRIYTFLNPVSYLIALENKSLFEQFDGIFADGSLLISAIRLVYGKRVTRRSFDMGPFLVNIQCHLLQLSLFADFRFGYLHFSDLP